MPEIGEEEYLQSLQKSGWPPRPGVKIQYRPNDDPDWWRVYHVLAVVDGVVLAKWWRKAKNRWQYEVISGSWWWVNAAREEPVATVTGRPSPRAIATVAFHSSRSTRSGTDIDFMDDMGNAYKMWIPADNLEEFANRADASSTFQITLEFEDGQ